jgi:hypothetical protein
MGGQIQKSITPGNRIEYAHPRGFDIHPKKNTFLCPPMGTLRQASLSIKNTTGLHRFEGNNKA